MCQNVLFFNLTLSLVEKPEKNHIIFKKEGGIIINVT